MAGETYIAVQPEELVVHPATGVVLGRQYSYIGQIRILCTDTQPGLSRAIVLEACREISIGARLKPMPQLPIPIARVPELPAWCDPPSGRTSGYIVDSREWAERPGPGDALWSAALVPHSVENVGASELHIVAVEVKQAG